MSGARGSGPFGIEGDLRDQTAAGQHYASFQKGY